MPDVDCSQLDSLLHSVYQQNQFIAIESDLHYLLNVDNFTKQEFQKPEMLVDRRDLWSDSEDENNCLIGIFKDEPVENHFLETKDIVKIKIQKESPCPPETEMPLELERAHSDISESEIKHFENGEKVSTTQKQTHPCPYCEYKATRNNNLQAHIKSVHEGYTFQCTQCEYIASSHSTLRRHIKSVHEGQLFPCPQCQFKSRRKDNLQTHINKVHGDQVFHCPPQIEHRNSLYQFIKPRSKQHSEDLIQKDNDGLYDYEKAFVSNNSHMELEDGRWKCDECGVIKNTKNSMQTHVRKTHGYRFDEEYCRICGQYVPNMLKLKSHLIKVHGTEIKNAPAHIVQFREKSFEIFYGLYASKFKQGDVWKCTECDFQAKAISNLNVHIRENHGDEFLQETCLGCGTVSKDLKTFKAHLEEEHDYIPRFRCVQCDYESDKRHAVWSHFDSVHGTIPPPKLSNTACGICGAIMDTKTDLRKHMVSLHPEQSLINFQNITETPEGYSKCNLCKKYVPDELTDHDCKNPLKCDNCGEIFKYHKAKLVHMEKVHGISRRYTCEICGFSSFYKGGLEKHKKAEHSETLEECAMCGENVRDLNTHMKKHNLRDWHCHHCGKAFKEKNTLQRHIRAVHNVEIKQCPHCKLKVKHLDAHIKKMHTSDHPYQCEHCGKGFLLRNEMNRHVMNIHLKLRPYTCRFEGCDWNTNDIGYRIIHEKKMHGLCVGRVNRSQTGHLKPGMTDD